MPKNNQQGLAHLFLIVAAAVVLALSGLWWFTHRNSPSINQNQQTNQQTEISGIIDFNGIAPAGSTITIAQKVFGSSDFQTVLENLPTQDKTKWSWTQAQSGHQYQIQAFLRSTDGKNLASSSIADVAAPANGVALIFNVISSSAQNNPQTQASLSGSIDLNGYIPAKSSLAIWVRPTNQSNFTLALDNLPAVDQTNWSWNQATGGLSYEVKAVISQGGKVVASSAPRMITAPASDEVLRINSVVTPDKIAPGSGIVSGKINLNGLSPAGSSIVIVSRPSGTTAYQVVVSGIPAQDGASWSWNQGTVGKMYDLQAVLKVNGSDFAISNTLTVAPPAFNEILVINSNVQQPQPSQSPFISCNGQSGGLWAVNITFNYVTAAGKQASQYWVRLGDASSDNRYLDSRVSAQNQSGQTQQLVTSPYVLGSGGTYYAKYAYSLNATSANLSDFSAWSNSTAITCPQSSPTNTPTPTHTPTPTPTLEPYKAACNESCGGDGYTCVTGLQCVESGLIGGSVCRNPNCTDKTNCTCI